MARTTNTVPYTNARRAGRTNPDLVEFRELVQTPSIGPWAGAMRALLVPNRVDLRAQGIRGPQRRRYAARCRKAAR